MKLNIKYDSDMFWTLVYQVVMAAGSLMLIKVLATSISVGDYGYYMLIMSIISLVLLVPFTPIYQGVTRYVSIYSNKGKYPEFLTSIVILIFVLFSLYLLFFLALYQLEFIPSYMEDVIVYIVIFALSEIFKTFFYALNNARLQRKNISIAVGIEFLIKIVTIFFYSLSNKVSLDFILLILILSNLIAVAIMFFDNMKEISINKKTNIKVFRVINSRIIYYSLPLIIWAPFGWIREMSYRWYLEYFHGAEQVAIFSMMATISMIAPLALQNLIGGYIIPIAYRKEDKSPGSVKGYLKLLLPIILLIFIFSTIITAIFSKEIIVLISDERYLVGSHMLPWMFGVYSLYVLSMISTMEIFAQKRVILLLYPNLLAGIVSIVSGFFLIKNFAVEGAMYSYLLTFITYSFFVFYVVIRFSKGLYSQSEK